MAFFCNIEHLQHIVPFPFSVQCHSTAQSIPHSHYIPPREIGENVQCGNAHNEHNERGGESIRRMYPLPLSLSLALHSSGGGYLGQGNKGHQLLSLYMHYKASAANSFKISDFSRTLLHLEDVEAKNGEKSMVGIVGLPPIWAIYISTLVSSPTDPRLVVNIGHSCQEHQRLIPAL